MYQNKHEYYMRRAINLARRGMGFTSPNPMVGAVIVKNGHVISEGYHEKAGETHAERMAIDGAREDVSGSTIYVNLEPCCHHGKTPPCTDYIIESGVKEVVAAMRDPFPEVSDQGFDKLRAAGIDVTIGILETSARELNEAYLKRVKTGLPFVIYKSAMTLDGKIALENGESQWITSEKSRKLSHFMRSRVDAILIGSGTVITDNPRLDVRLKKKMKNPCPIIIDAELKIPLNTRLVEDASNRGTIIFTSNTSHCGKIDQLKDMGVNVILIPLGKERRKQDSQQDTKTSGDGNKYYIDIEKVMKKIADLGICRILLECGGNLAFTMLDKGLVDKMMLFVAPKIFGGSRSFTTVEGVGVDKVMNAIEIEGMKARKIGTDFLFEGYIKKESRGF